VRVSTDCALTILVAEDEVLGSLSKLVVDLLHACRYVELKVLNTPFALLRALKDLNVLDRQCVTSLLAAVAEAQIVAARLRLGFQIGREIEIAVETDDILLLVALRVRLLRLLELLVGVRVSVDLDGHGLDADFGRNLLRKE
jgi:hypothetical protein